MIEPKPETELSEHLPPGTKLMQGQYTIEKFLNSGGFGITYLAKDSLDRIVVIKECYPGAICRREHTTVAPRSRAKQNEFKSAIKFFVREARNLAKLSHPNIVGVHQVFEDNETAYMAIDFVEGRDLLDILEDKGTKFTPDFIVHVLTKLLHAIGFMHKNGILHRDISPDNILINQQGEPILIDFGAAREEVATTGRALSALSVIKDGYSPQEFYVTGSLQNDSSDLYALGATMYHCIAGEMPPNSQVRLAAMAEGTENPYKKLTGRFKGYPNGFLEAIDKALEVISRHRLQTADEWLAEIDPTVKSKPAKSSKTSKANPSVSAPTTASQPKTGGKKTGVLMATAASVVLLLAGGLYFKDTILGSNGNDVAAGEKPAPSVVVAPVKEPEVANVEVMSKPEEQPAVAPVETVEVLPTPEEVVILEAPKTPSDNTVTEPKTEPAKKPAEVVQTEPSAEKSDIAVFEKIALQSQLISGWELDIPFKINNDSLISETSSLSGLPTITEVSPLAKLTSIGDWITVGASVYSVDGKILGAEDDIKAVVERHFNPAAPKVVQARLKIINPNSAALEDVSVEFGYIKKIALQNGTALVQMRVDGDWRMVVESIPTNIESNLRVGDQLLSETTTGHKIDTAEELVSVLYDLEALKERDAMFEILRDNKPATASISLLAWR